MSCKDIESRHGRQPAERWAPRTLDIDMLLYDNEVIETTMLTLPHPRMTFRRFVLEPAAEIAPRMLHPIIGWPVERLLLHLDAASDQAALVSPSEALRRKLAAIDCRTIRRRRRSSRRLSRRPSSFGRRVTTWLAIRPIGRERSASATEQPAACRMRPRRFQS